MFYCRVLVGRNRKVIQSIIDRETHILDGCITQLRHAAAAVIAWVIPLELTALERDIIYQS